MSCRRVTGVPEGFCGAKSEELRDRPHPVHRLGGGRDRPLGVLRSEPGGPDHLIPIHQGDGDGGELLLFPFPLDHGLQRRGHVAVVGGGLDIGAALGSRLRRAAHDEDQEDAEAPGEVSDRGGPVVAAARR
jgi:hypothetical protein